VTYPVILPAVVLEPTTVIRHTENATTSNLTVIDPATGAALATSKTFYLRGDNAADDLCRVIRQTLDSNTNAVNPNTYSCTISRNIDGTALPATVTISRATGASNFTIDWANAATTFDERLLGFRNVSTGSVTTTTGDVSPTGQWVANDIYEFFESEEEVAAFVERARSGVVIGGRRGGPYDVRRLALRFQTEQRTVIKAVPTISSVVDTGRAFAACWARLCTGRPFELHFATISAGTTLAALSSSTRQPCFNGAGTAWHLDADTVESGFRPERLAPGVGLYAWTLRMLGEVP